MAVIRKIVLTGGPGAGKSTAARMIAKTHPQQFVLVPESATQIYQRHQTRWDRADDQQRRAIQRSIYFHQLQQEQEFAELAGERSLLLDRGTIDGAAYWPDGPQAYWDSLNTSHQAELARYHQVLLLQSSAAVGVYDGAISNDVRFEDAQAALRSDQTLSELWAPHPNLTRIPAHPDFNVKLGKILEALGLAR